MLKTFCLSTKKKTKHMVFASARLRGHLWRNRAASSLALERHQKSAIVSFYNFEKYQTWHSQTLLVCLLRKEVCTENTLWHRVSPFILHRQLIGHLALHFAKDCGPTAVLVKSRLGSSGCLVVRSFVRCHHAENGPIHRKMPADCPLAITSIVETPFQTRPGKRNDWFS